MGLFADALTVLQAVDAPPYISSFAIWHPQHPAVGTAALTADQQFTEGIHPAIFPQLRLDSAGSFAQAGTPGKLLLYPLESFTVDNSRVVFMHIVFWKLWPVR